MSARVLFWDIDGTLLTTARAGVFALEEAAREVCGAEVDFASLKTAGLTDWEVALLSIETAGREPTPESASAFLRVYERHLPDRLHWRKGRVLPGVTEALDALSERPDVSNLLLTGNTRAGASAKLAHYRLDRYFDDGAFCEDGDDRPSIARRALALARERSNGTVDPEHVVVIGDTPHDVRGGLAIGARTLGVASGAYAEADLMESGAWTTLPHLPPAGALMRLLGMAGED
jgi:phosphoglycolate phosphatase-like HAD superfamily hydrolase